MDSVRGGGGGGGGFVVGSAAATTTTTTVTTAATPPAASGLNSFSSADGVVSAASSLGASLAGEVAGGAAGATGASRAAAGMFGLGQGDSAEPILYSEPNRTSAIDDIRSVVIYIFIVTIFLSFFLILPGIRNEKLPTFLCVTTSLIVTSIILVALFGTTWHVAEAPILAAYKAFSRDRIQGELSVNIGLQSVNISLRAHKYYILHATHGPIIMMKGLGDELAEAAKATTTTAATTITSAGTPPGAGPSAAPDSDGADRELPNSSDAALFIAGPAATPAPASGPKPRQPGPETTPGRPPPATPATDHNELEVEEVFGGERARRLARAKRQRNTSQRRPALSPATATTPESPTSQSSPNSRPPISKRATGANANKEQVLEEKQPPSSSAQKFTIVHANVDINFNERFYWIGPSQMRQEHHKALERGLPFPILTVVEYLSQDEAGFSWSRQYRAAGYYTNTLLWLALGVCALMFLLHCAAPKYGIYTMQLLGGLLLFTNLTYATLVPRGEQKLVIPFEGQSLRFRFGWDFWLVLIGGALSLVIGTLIVLIDCIFPNFMLTTILDVDYDARSRHHRRRKLQQQQQQSKPRKRASQQQSLAAPLAALQRPHQPPFIQNHYTASAGAALAGAPARRAPPGAAAATTPTSTLTNNSSQTAAAAAAAAAELHSAISSAPGLRPSAGRGAGAEGRDNHHKRHHFKTAAGEPPPGADSPTKLHLSNGSGQQVWQVERL